ncbi:hypothetical protein BX616_005955 [Lobosporangium transversale]|uniref:Snurportin-1 n=1 Tax=Lobosporangium transversale TaxID=64571 RepID=A0A1Y2H1R8_9FUNG|nr:hypothetical protein BCR41DRAFT_418684 [Lobosporangium transversale]KAF9918763.1 hypothetical protein BX616_005955 [Lobosporangium transversale]ORZ27653.1 hypothetical protein BCR41DRAFT_418684 [Lobosporangium transversale]|eukprot:XP_021885356.1 hypothetical protein BCR41DRAFT_418684 [Lobosporangium transversale]
MSNGDKNSNTVSNNRNVNGHVQDVSTPMHGHEPTSPNATSITHMSVPLLLSLPPDFASPITTTSTTASITTSTATTVSNMTSISTSTAATTTPIASSCVVSQKTIEVLGDWLLESVSVQPLLGSQEQRRKQSFKSNSLINKTMKQSQEERRKQALAEQAKKRYQFTNHARKLALFASGQPSDGSSSSEDDDSRDDNDDEDDEDEDQEDDDVDDDERHEKRKKNRLSKHLSVNKENNEQEESRILPQLKATTAHKRRLSFGSESETAAGRKTDNVDVLSPKKPRLQKKSGSKAHRKKKRERNPFKDQLMIPETMSDIPVDLDTNYYIVPLPVGHRCFVISADGKTTARLPSGQLLASPFESCLPAGSNQYRGNRRSDYCILDCVYSPITRTFWTFDIMCWRGHPVYDCETEFRFWWLRGKLAEIEELQGKWIANQIKERDTEAIKRKEKQARRTKKRQENAGHPKPSNVALEEVGEEGGEDAGSEDMDIEAGSRINGSTNLSGSGKFWPIVFTPLPYFNASINLIRLLAESMYQPSPSPPSIGSPCTAASALLSVPHNLSLSSRNTSASAAPFDLTSTSPISTQSHGSNGNQNESHQNGAIVPVSPLGTMALSGEIATAASLFPAHDITQKTRQGNTLAYERAAGLVFFNKKTMYVLGTTPLCGWVAMEQIGDVFFDEEGGVGPVPGTSAVEGREIEMEDALQRIRI